MTKTFSIDETLKDGLSDCSTNLWFNSRVSSRGYEIEAAVHSGVGDALLSGDVHLLLQELLILLVDVLANGLPAVGREKYHFTR